MSVDCNGTDSPVCPYCGAADNASSEIRNDSSVQTCGTCGEEYRCERIVVVSFTTARVGK